MSENECIALLGGWTGYGVGTVGRFEAGVKGPRPEAWIELRPRPDRQKRCSGCDDVVSAVHDSVDRWIRDLPVWGADTWLMVPRCRLACPRCGPKLESLAWLDRYSRVTRRLAESVARLCAVLPVKHVAEFFGLDWSTVKAIDHAWLSDTMGPVSLVGVETIVMDEFAIQKGHRYATVVAEPATRRVLWVGRGRSREEVRAFFEQIGPDACARLRAVGMDMTAAYELEVRHYCPQAVVVFDLFHVIAKFGREVIDRVRVDEANRLRKDPHARQVVKGARWLLLRRRENLRSEDDHVRLDELLRANRHLMTVYVLRDDLRALWAYRQPAAARRFWEGWYRRAIRSRIQPLKRFARNLRGYLHGILAHCRWPLHTSVLEGINNKIKVIKRMAYGFRDDSYFFLKIRAAFPGVS